MASRRGGALDFEVSRDDLHRIRVREREIPQPRAREALLRVERFGFSSNNITYALLGDALGYWSFFPAADGFGRIPVWGFAEVVASAANDLAEGVRVFGYCPMSTHLVVRPGRTDDAGFRDAAPHRARLPAAYNAYRRVDADPGYEPDREDQQLLLRPLFFLSFLLDDYLAENELFGAETVVVSSASSKAAPGLAFLLSRRGVPVVGLTSKVAAVEELGVYDRVIAYDAIDALGDAPTTFADLAGDAAVRRAVHERLGDRLRHSAAVGLTHADRAASRADNRALPGSAPVSFFAPDRLRARTREWGQAALDARLAAAWRPFIEWSDKWLEIEHTHGPSGVEAVYRQVLDGRVAPTAGHVALGDCSHSDKSKFRRSQP
jgi:NADPH:quinone reductase-like Zn-dependent oxidoreductase